MRNLLPYAVLVLLGCSESAPTPVDAQVSDIPTADLPATDAPATDAPATDAPATDALPMDAPASACGSCGGANPLCAWAPGCMTATPRFCAPDTCGDAVAIAYCGCDGVTFTSGCIYPDRPYRHAGPCNAGDGGGGDGGAERPVDLVIDGGTGCADNGTLRRMCTCANPGNAAVACGESQSCRLYPNGCLEAGTVPCTLRGYRDVPGLRERCLAFCDALRAAEPSAQCPIAAP